MRSYSNIEIQFESKEIIFIWHGIQNKKKVSFIIGVKLIDIYFYEYQKEWLMIYKLFRLKSSGNSKKHWYGIESNAKNVIDVKWYSGTVWLESSQLICI